jgi:DNA-binding LytR/AlgR family response regulator
MIRGTFMVGVFPIVALGVIALLRKERKYQHIAEEINLEMSTKSESTSSEDSILFDIPSSQIRYVEALQNYVKIGHLSAEGQWKEKTERATLKSILNEVEGSALVKCHRSFLINRETITSTSGNAQGLLLQLANCEKSIPVSRSFVGSFR